MSAISAKEFAESLAAQINAFEAETGTHDVDLVSCCCKEELLIRDGMSTYAVDLFNEGTGDNPGYTWKAVKKDD